MRYTLVEYRDGNERIAWELENPNGEIISTYDQKPAHPMDTAEDISDDFSNNPQDMFVFIMQRKWDFRVEQS